MLFTEFWEYLKFGFDFRNFSEFVGFLNNYLWNKCEFIDWFGYIALGASGFIDD